MYCWIYKYRYVLINPLRLLKFKRFTGISSLLPNIRQTFIARSPKLKKTVYSVIIRLVVWASVMVQVVSSHKTSLVALFVEF